MSTPARNKCTAVLCLMLWGCRRCAFDYNPQNGNVVNIAAEGGKLELLLQHCMLAGRRAVVAP
jgi:hypothetical protein